MTWTEQVLAMLATWFNRSDNPTPQEIHQEMENVGSLEGLRASIREEIEAQSREQIQTLTEARSNAEAQLSTAQSRITELETELSTARARVTELESIEGEHTKQKSTGDSNDGGTKTEMPVWESFKAQLGLE
jgi:chromosome segregation ATPase